MDLKEESNRFNSETKTDEYQPVNVKNQIKITHLKFRMLKTLVLFLSWIALGLFSEILGPALPALQVLTNTNYEEISRSLSSRSVGLLLGSFFGGFLADIFMKYRNFLIFIFLSIAGLTIATVPLCRSLPVLALNLFISGFSHGGFTTSGNPSLGALWKESSTGPYNFMHSGYGLGGALAPLFVKAFDLSNQTTLSNSTYSIDSASFIQSPFLFVAIYCIVIGLIFLTYGFLPDPLSESEVLRNPKSRISINVPSHQDDVVVKRGYLYNIRRDIIAQLKTIERRYALLMILCFISYFALVGNERIFGKFQFSYAIKGQLNMIRSRGYLINCLYWVSFCLGRVIVALLAVRISAKILLIAEICGALLSSMVFTIWNKSELIFFVFSTSFGFFKSPLFPTMLGVLNLYTTVSGILVIVVNFGSAAGAASCQYLMGYLIQNYGQFTFPITVTGTSVFLLIVFLCVLFITRKWKKV